MTEATKTLAFVAAAILSVVLAIVSRPSSGEYDPSDQLGKPIAKAFAAGDAKRLSIVEVDEATATLETFEVAEQNGVWSLPSKGGYPADAERQLAEAVTGVNDVEILSIASQSAEDHAEYGVIDPSSSKLEPGQTGVGTRVSLASDSGESLVDLIIGAEVKDQDEQRYVRRAGQDVVFVVEIDPENFSTDFSEWIESDLLKISPWDIRTVRLRDYSAELFMTLQGLGAETTFRTDTTLRYDDGESAWELAELLVAPDPAADEYEPAELAGDEELNEEALNDLKSALDDLSIVDVSSKPEGLSEDLKAGEEFLNNQQSMMSLVQRGFAPTRNKAGELDLLSSEGEVIVTMKDGVEYVLRFGNLELDADAAESAGGDPAGGAEEPGEDGAGEGGDEGAGEGVNRYLFVMAQFNADSVEKPELEEVPPLPEPEAGAETDNAADGAADTEETDTEETGAEEGGDGESGDEQPGDEETDAEEAAADEPTGTSSSDEAAGDEVSDDEASDDEPTAYEQAVAERKDIEERNARLLDEYEAKLAAGRDRVTELNARFGDWYYVISNDVYQKIRLGRGDVIKKKEADEEGSTDDPADGGSAFGAPGAAVPGLPGLGAAVGEEEEADEEPAADEPGPEGVPAESEEAEPTAPAPTGESTPADSPASETESAAGNGDPPAEEPTDDGPGSV